MQRRTFIKYNALAALSITPLFADMAHNMHDMDSMSGHHHGTHDSSTHTTHSTHASHNAPIDTSFITLENENLPLLNPKDLRQNEPLYPLPRLTNTSKKQGQFHASIEVAEAHLPLVKGKQTKFYIYNDTMTKAVSYIAPKIEVYEGDRVKIEVKNSLKEPTTIHWHGLPVPPSQDGNPMDSIPPEGSRIYEFELPNDCAGTYWYHPHPHQATAKQVYMGLAGAFVVKSRDHALKDFSESDWFITDLRLDTNGQIPANSLSDWLDGREGELVLINGQHKPQINAKSKQRIRIYNACSARYLSLEIEGADFMLVGTDGGLIEKPMRQKRLFLSPASRAEVLIHNAKKGSFKLLSHLYDRDKMMSKDEPKILNLATLHINSLPSALPSRLRTFPPLPKSAQELHITMSEDHSKMHGLIKQSKEQIRQNLAAMFLLNGKVFGMNDVDLRVQRGVVHDIVVTNKSHMDHPFHIHGTQFEVVEQILNGRSEKTAFRAFRDTINVRPNESLRLRMKQSFKGARMFHCHILEHEDLGMMGNLVVE